MLCAVGESSSDRLLNFSLDPNTSTSVTSFAGDYLFSAIVSYLLLGSVHVRVRITICQSVANIVE